MIYFQTILHAPVLVLWHCARPENHGLAAKARSSMRNKETFLMCLEKFSEFSFVLQYGKCPTLTQDMWLEFAKWFGIICYIANEVAVKRCEKIGQGRWAKPFLHEMETLLAVMEDGARRDVEQLCRAPYPKTWSFVTEVLLTDLGLELLQNLQALRLHSCYGQFVQVVSWYKWAALYSRWTFLELQLTISYVICSHIYTFSFLNTCWCVGFGYFWPSENISLSALWNEKGNAQGKVYMLIFKVRNTLNFLIPLIYSFTGSVITYYLAPKEKEVEEVKWHESSFW